MPACYDSQRNFPESKLATPSMFSPDDGPDGGLAGRSDDPTSPHGVTGAGDIGRKILILLIGGVIFGVLYFSEILPFYGAVVLSMAAGVSTKLTLQMSLAIMQTVKIVLVQKMEDRYQTMLRITSDILSENMGRAGRGGKDSFQQFDMQGMSIRCFVFEKGDYTNPDIAESAEYLQYELDESGGGFCFYNQNNGQFTLFIDGDKYPQEVRPFMAVHEYGEMVFSDHARATRLEFTVAKKERRLTRYINWLKKNHPSKFANVVTVVQNHDNFVPENIEGDEDYRDERAEIDRSSSAQIAKDLIDDDGEGGDYQWPMSSLYKVIKTAENYNERAEKIVEDVLGKVAKEAKKGLGKGDSWELYLNRLDYKAKMAVTRLNKSKVNLNYLNRDRIRNLWLKKRKEIAGIVSAKWDEHKRDKGETDASAELSSKGLESPLLEDHGIFKTGTDIIDLLFPEIAQRKRNTVEIRAGWKKDDAKEKKKSVIESLRTGIILKVEWEEEVDEGGIVIFNVDGEIVELDTGPGRGMVTIRGLEDREMGWIYRTEKTVKGALIIKNFKLNLDSSKGIFIFDEITESDRMEHVAGRAKKEAALYIQSGITDRSFDWREEADDCEIHFDIDGNTLAHDAGPDAEEVAVTIYFNSIFGWVFKTEDEEGNVAKSVLSKDGDDWIITNKNDDRELFLLAAADNMEYLSSGQKGDLLGRSESWDIEVEDESGEVEFKFVDIEGEEHFMVLETGPGKGCALITREFIGHGKYIYRVKKDLNEYGKMKEGIIYSKVEIVRAGGNRFRFYPYENLTISVFRHLQEPFDFEEHERIMKPSVWRTNSNGEIEFDTLSGRKAVLQTPEEGKAWVEVSRNFDDEFGWFYRVRGFETGDTKESRLMYNVEDSYWYFEPCDSAELTREWGGIRSQTTKHLEADDPDTFAEIEEITCTVMTDDKGKIEFRAKRFDVSGGTLLKKADSVYLNTGADGRKLVRVHIYQGDLPSGERGWIYETEVLDVPNSVKKSIVVRKDGSRGGRDQKYSTFEKLDWTKKITPEIIKSVNNHIGQKNPKRKRATSDLTWEQDVTGPGKISFYFGNTSLDTGPGAGRVVVKRYYGQMPDGTNNWIYESHKTCKNPETDSEMVIITKSILNKGTNTNIFTKFDITYEGDDLPLEGFIMNHFHKSNPGASDAVVRSTWKVDVNARGYKELNWMNNGQRKQFRLNSGRQRAGKIDVRCYYDSDHGWIYETVREVKNEAKVITVRNRLINRGTDINRDWQLEQLDVNEEYVDVQIYDDDSAGNIGQWVEYKIDEDSREIVIRRKVKDGDVLLKTNYIPIAVSELSKRKRRIKKLAKKIFAGKERGFLDMLDQIISSDGCINLFKGNSESRAAGAFAHMYNGRLYIDEVLFNNPDTNVADMTIIHEVLHVYLRGNNKFNSIPKMIEHIDKSNIPERMKIKINNIAKMHPEGISDEDKEAYLYHYYSRYYLQNNKRGKPYEKSANKKLTEEIHRIRKESKIKILSKRFRGKREYDLAEGKKRLSNTQLVELKGYLGRGNIEKSVEMLVAFYLSDLEGIDNSEFRRCMITAFKRYSKDYVASDPVVLEGIFVEYFDSEFLSDYQNKLVHLWNLTGEGRYYAIVDFIIDCIDIGIAIQIGERGYVDPRQAVSRRKNFYRVYGNFMDEPFNAQEIAPDNIVINKEGTAIESGDEDMVITKAYKHYSPQEKDYRVFLIADYRGRRMVFYRSVSHKTWRRVEIVGNRIIRKTVAENALNLNTDLCMKLNKVVEAGELNIEEIGKSKDMLRTREDRREHNGILCAVLEIERILKPKSPVELKLTYGIPFERYSMWNQVGRDPAHLTEINPYNADQWFYENLSKLRGKALLTSGDTEEEHLMFATSI